MKGIPNVPTKPLAASLLTCVNNKPGCIIPAVAYITGRRAFPYGRHTEPPPSQTPSAESQACHMDTLTH